MNDPPATAHGALNPSSPFAVVVNDDLTLLNVLCGLVRVAGLEPRAFTGVEAALADMTAKAGSSDRDSAPLPAIIITDLYMPGIDGWRFCRLLRSPDFAAFNQVPILVVSATYAGDEASRVAADLGAEAFLPSPVDGPRFVEQVKTILRGERLRIPLRVLIVEDSEIQSGIVRKEFEANGYQAETVHTARAASAAFRQTAYDVAVLDHYLSDRTGDTLLDEFSALRPECVCLMMTDDPGPELALDWMKRGAVGYVHKPFQPAYLIELCARARRERSLLRLQDLLDIRTRELRESEEKHRILLEESSDPIFSFTPEGRYTYVNRAFAEGVGKPVADIIGKRIWDVFPKEEADTRFAALTQVFRTGKEKVIEARVPRVDGDRYYMTTISPIADEAGEVVAAICSSKDITARKLAEEKLVYIMKAVESASDAIGISDSLGRHVYQNKALADLFEYASAEELEAAGGGRAVIKEPEIAIEMFEKIMSGNSWVGELEMVTKSGRVFPALERADAIKDHDGNIIGLIGIIADITERKREEKEKTALEALNRQLQKSESLGRMAGAISHHFNNQLQTVSLNLEMAIGELPPAAGRSWEFLKDAQQAIRHASEVSGLMLTYLGLSIVSQVPHNLSEICRRNLPMLQAAMPKNVAMETDLTSPGPVVRANVNQMQQVLTNLVINAWEAGGIAPCVIRLSVKKVVSSEIPEGHRFPIDWQPRHDAYACLEVADTGCGIAYEDIEKIFDPFFSSKFTGRGMGLAVVLGIVRAHEGVITAESDVGRGSTFRVYLPMTEGATEQLRIADCELRVGEGG